MNDQGPEPTLNELRRELEAVGLVVVPFGNEIHVRRSTLEYIKVRIDDGVLRCEPCIGFMSQARATWVLLLGVTLGIPALFHRNGATAESLSTAFLAAIGFVFHSLRYTLADLSINRVQAIWLDLKARHRLATSAAPALADSKTATMLPTSSARSLPAETARQAPAEHRFPAPHSRGQA